jgi:ribonuclease HI
MPSKPTIIFTDGACSGNPGRGGWAAIVISPDGHVSEVGGSDLQTTNNRMEMTATIEGLAIADSPAVVYTDSTYVIRGITQWIFGWMRNGWKSSEGGEVTNKDLWQKLAKVSGNKKPVSWKYVRGHTGVPGNERCDQIAVAFSQGQTITLYDGSLKNYGVSIMDLPPDNGLPEMKSKSEKAAVHSYLSLIGSIPMRHSTWAECEARVKGRSGAKFKKAMSAGDEETILKSWGIDPSKLK